jgi:hypothetical protein
MTDMPTFHHKVVLYVIISKEVKDRIREISALNERSITSITEFALRKGLGMEQLTISPGEIQPSLF